jgi:hypothetical protein
MKPLNTNKSVTNKPLMLGVIMLNVVMLKVIMLNVMTPKAMQPLITSGQCCKTFYGRKLRLFIIS